jgi:NitT/TauT family transport system ATP-binding protein
LADRVTVLSARPGRLKQIFRIPFERPRALHLKRDPRFLEIEDAIWRLIEEEAERIGVLAADDTSADAKPLPALTTGFDG